MPPEIPAILKKPRWRNFFATRPPAVQALMIQYPPNTRFLMHGHIMHIIAWGENGGLSVTPVDPDFDYEKAVARRVRVCPCCLDKLETLRLDQS